jgi:hypothetical protein
MSAVRFSLCVIVAWGCCIAASAGTISGEDFLDLSAKDKGWYFVGALDAMKETREAYFRASELDAAEFDRVWQSCISGKSIRQHLAMFEAWLNAHPERWHESAITLIFESKRTSCKQRQEELLED